MERQQPRRQIARAGLADAIGDMFQARSINGNHPPPHVHQSGINAQNPHNRPLFIVA
jgi:hypothetical protein